MKADRLQTLIDRGDTGRSILTRVERYAKRLQRRGVRATTLRLNAVQLTAVAMLLWRDDANGMTPKRIAREVVAMASCGQLTVGELKVVLGKSLAVAGKAKDC